MIDRLDRFPIGWPATDLASNDRLAVERTLRECVAKLLGGEVGVLAAVPFDQQCLESLLCGPEMVADHGDRIGDADHVDDAWHRTGGLVVDRSELAVEGRARLDDGDLHAGHTHVQAELGGTLDLVGGIHTPQRFADQLEILGVSELHLVRHRQLACRRGHRAEANAAAGWDVVNHAPVHRACRRVDMPLRRRGSHQQCPCHGTGFAQHLPGAACAGGAAGNLATQERHAIQVIAGR